MRDILPRLGYVFGLWLVATLAVAQPVVPPGLLWRIDRGDLPAPSYLFGTIHLICDPKAVQTPALRTALAASDQLVVELDLTDPNVTLKALELALLPNGQTLHDLLPPDSVAIAERFLRDSLGLAPKGLLRMKPLLVAGVLYSRILPCPSASVDLDLMQQAKERGLPIVPLETPADQIRMFDRLSPQRQARVLIRSLVEYAEGEALFQELMNAYLAQDLPRLADAVKRSSASEPELMRGLGPERNRLWLPHLEALMAQRSSFIAVGAAHLVGDDSLVDLLRRAGYTVEPVPATAVAAGPQAQVPGVPD